MTVDEKYSVGGCECVKNAKVYGLEDSIKRAKFPLAVNVDKLNTELTSGIKALAQSKQGEGKE